MTNITAVSLVLVLTGTPVTSVVCVTECRGEPATSGHCHGDMATSNGPRISANDTCHGPSINGSPFVTEHRAVPGAAVLATSLLPTTPGLVRTDAPAVHARAAEAWLKPPLVLRL
jgi:hypothetical protein